MPSHKRQSTRQAIYRIMEDADKKDETSKLFDLTLSTLIVINVLIVIIETVPSVAAKYGYYLILADAIIATIFTIEYALRIWSATAAKKYSHPVFGRIRFALTPLAIIDLVAILPLFLPLFLPFSLPALRVLRLFRVARIMKIFRYSEGLQAFGQVIRDKRRPLLASLVILALGLLFSSTVIYLAEHNAQPQHFGSIPASLWWATITLSTVGYGDVIPITPLGRLFGALVALLGIGVFAIPAGILASGYMRASLQLERAKSRRRKTK